MGASVSHKLKNSMQGALAGGGDPATSPLYVFGPFLSLIVGAGVAEVTFGTSIWLAVFTVVSVSATYRYVMRWITDGSGGSGLSEEEFGSWAVKVNAAITVIEYSLTFLVSMAALVTFIADRVPVFNLTFAGFNLRTLVAIALSVVIAVLVNRGPKLAAKCFGPATALILIFLWVMIGCVIWENGLHLPGFHWAAFDSFHINFTLGGFARILALMTGIEIFANLVASYEGKPAERSRKAFGSLMIVMGTTISTMLIVGPAILEFSDPTRLDKSVFTQTMDQVLPFWLSYLGTLIGIAVLLSACAASTQGIQNLALGLRARHYIPARWGNRNRFEVPSIPSWVQIAAVIACFLIFGTHEETYLALYAAGVFVLLSMTGWAAFKRFLRLRKARNSSENLIGILVSAFSAICATFATLVIFDERFMAGAWIYLLLIPGLYIGFDYFRRRLGPPPEAIEDRLSAALLGVPRAPNLSRQNGFQVRKILVPMNETLAADTALLAASQVAEAFGAHISAAHVIGKGVESKLKAQEYVNYISNAWTQNQRIEPLLIHTTTSTPAEVSDEIVKRCSDHSFDLICLSSTKLLATNSLLRDSTAYKILYATTPPVLIFRPTDHWRSRSTQFKNILVPLDGSEVAEQILPIVSSWAETYSAKVTLLSTPETDGHAAIKEKLGLYLERIREHHFSMELNVQTVVEGSGSTATILKYVEDDKSDLIALVSHGRGGLERQNYVKLGSVAEGVMIGCDIPLLFISAKEEPLKN